MTTVTSGRRSRWWRPAHEVGAVRQQRYAEAEPELLAGYEVLAKQAAPSVRWLQSARGDLVRVYEATGQPEKAQPFR